jgi:hypothetical protein
MVNKHLNPRWQKAFNYNPSQNKARFFALVITIILLVFLIISLVSCAPQENSSESSKSIVHPEEVVKPDYTSAIVHLLKEKCDIEVKGDFPAECKEGDTVLVVQYIIHSYSGRVYNWEYINSPVSIRDTIFSNSGDICVCRNAVIYSLMYDTE